jgi:hypothetical protein
MGPRPGPKYTVERKENSGHYEPGNCCWATYKEQQNHRTNNRRLTLNGRTQTLTQWAEETGLQRQTIARRLALGWTADEALTIPLRGSI